MNQPNTFRKRTNEGTDKKSSVVVIVDTVLQLTWLELIGIESPVEQSHFQVLERLEISRIDVLLVFLLLLLLVVLLNSSKRQQSGVWCDESIKK